MTSISKHWHQYLDCSNEQPSAGRHKEIIYCCHQFTILRWQILDTAINTHLESRVFNQFILLGWWRTKRVPGWAYFLGDLTFGSKWFLTRGSGGARRIKTQHKNCQENWSPSLGFFVHSQCFKLESVDTISKPVFSSKKERRISRPNARCKKQVGPGLVAALVRTRTVENVFYVWQEAWLCGDCRVDGNWCVPDLPATFSPFIYWKYTILSMLRMCKMFRRKQT